MCDTFVALADATIDGSVILAKNSDREPNEAHEVVLVAAAEHQPTDSVRCTYVEIPQAGRYALTARVATVQDNPKLQLTANGAKESVEIPVPYTIGKWQQTEPVQVSLVQGRNSLRLTRPDGSRGLGIKEFTLTPVK